MHRCLLVGFAGLWLIGCQSVNPYDGPSTPPPAASAAPTAYPATAADFSGYRSWSWRSSPAGSGVLGPEQVAEMVSGALDQRGLRPAPAGQRGDLEIAVDVRRETRQRQVHDRIDPYYGHGLHRGGHYGYDRFGVIASRPMVRTYTEQVTAVQLQLFDAGDGQSLWRTQASSTGSHPDALREALRRALDDYPPR
ncbi:DUF4136 domain-containing protein [Stutzerimonas tarimensis]|uniref:DUF4136 domain-containing protein n=1 Tax=Stutzerimonas tarimensis TaxID=1507735 RepID=A0ABV7TD10_9GAMM